MALNNVSLFKTRQKYSQKICREPNYHFSLLSLKCFSNFCEGFLSVTLIKFRIPNTKLDKKIIYDLLHISLRIWNESYYYVLGTELLKRFISTWMPKILVLWTTVASSLQIFTQHLFNFQFSFLLTKANPLISKERTFNELLQFH